MPRPTLVLGLFLSLAGVLALACDKPDGTSPPPVASASATPASAPGPAASSAPAVVESAAPSASGTPSASAAPSAAPAASGSATPESCGTKPLPDCPLQAWMKANANPPMSKGDLPGLQAALEKMVALAPPGSGYPNWVSISKDGANAAKGGDMSGAKASCRTCHDQYKAKYRAELRARKI